VKGNHCRVDKPLDDDDDDEKLNADDGYGAVS
jgi:hypothetical protein